MNDAVFCTQNEDERGIRALNFLMQKRIREMFDNRYETVVLTGQGKAVGRMIAIFTYPTNRGIWLSKGQLWLDVTRIEEACIPAWIDTPLMASLMPGRESRDRQERVQRALLELVRVYLAFDPDKQVVPWWDHDYRLDVHASGVPRISEGKLARILAWRQNMINALFPKNIWMLG